MSPKDLEILLILIISLDKQAWKKITQRSLSINSIGQRLLIVCNKLQCVRNSNSHIKRVTFLHAT